MKKNEILLLAAMTLSATQAMAFDTGTPLQVNGFGTFAGVHNDNEDVSFYDASQHTDWDTDSIVGLQISLPITDKLSATSQFVARGYENYDLKTDWLFLSYKATNDLDVRAGRMRIPFFMFSDSLEVGYSYPWVRPPVDVYDQLGFNSFDGADIVYTFPVASMQLELQPFMGSTNPDMIRPGQNGELEVTDLWGLHGILSNDWISLHFSHTEGDYDIENIKSINGFLTGLETTGYTSVADKFGVDDKHGTFSSVGIDANWQNFRLISEYTERTSDGLIANSSGWYTTLGYQMGQWMPHLTFSQLETHEDYSDEMEDAAAMPAMLGMLAGGTRQFAKVNSENQKSVTAGLRWDVAKNTAIKFEWQHINPDNDSTPTFQVIDPDYSGEDVNVYTIAVDFVF